MNWCDHKPTYGPYYRRHISREEFLLNREWFPTPPFFSYQTLVVFIFRLFFTIFISRGGGGIGHEFTCSSVCEFGAIFSSDGIGSNNLPIAVEEKFKHITLERCHYILLVRIKSDKRLLLKESFTDKYRQMRKHILMDNHEWQRWKRNLMPFAI